MNASTASLDSAQPLVPNLEVARDLEDGRLIELSSCPFPLPEGAARSFLSEQRLKTAWHPHIRFEPDTRRVRGFARHAPGQMERLRDVLAGLATAAADWLALCAPSYAAGSHLDYVALHPEEEATRTLGPAERNDLLHLDTSIRRPTLGRRLLRLFVNLHPNDPRVWLTSLRFSELLKRYHSQWELPSRRRSWLRPLQDRWQRWLWADRHAASPYDDFLLKLNALVRRDDDLQERAPKKCWHFAPDAAWLVFTDGLCHAELRGRFVLEFAWFIAVERLASPELAPVTQIQSVLATTDPARAA